MASWYNRDSLSLGRNSKVYCSPRSYHNVDYESFVEEYWERHISIRRGGLPDFFASGILWVFCILWDFTHLCKDWIYARLLVPLPCPHYTCSGCVTKELVDSNCALGDHPYLVGILVLNFQIRAYSLLQDLRYHKDTEICICHCHCEEYPSTRMLGPRHLCSHDQRMSAHLNASHRSQSRSNGRNTR